MRGHFAYSKRGVFLEKSKTMPTLTVEQCEKILGGVCFKDGFHFYWNLEHYTGKTATRLADFIKIIQEIDLQSIEFHNSINGFEKWFEELGDSELAEKMREIRKSKISGEALRQKIFQVAKKRYDELLETYYKLKVNDQFKVVKTTKFENETLHK
jgi:preprotein translocase subunit SecA